MTLKERILETLESEKRAIDAAIFVIKSSKTLDAIALDLPVPVAPVEAPRRSARSSSTPPQADDTEGD